MKKVRTKKKYSFILTISLIAIVGSFVIFLVFLQTKIKGKELEANQLKAQIEEQSLKNAELDRIINSDSEEEYIERIARDSLGYVKIGEKVYKEASPSD